MEEVKVEVAPEGETAPVEKEGRGPSAQVPKEQLGPSGNIVTMVIPAPEGTLYPSEGKTGISKQKTGAALATALYHARVLAGRSVEGEEARVVADRFVGVMEDVAVQSMARLTEADLLRGFCLAQMEAATLATALMNKVACSRMEVEPLGAQLEEVKLRLQNLRVETAGWRKAARSACAKGLEYVRRAKNIEVLALVQSYSVEQSSTELLATKSELEAEHHKAISLEFELVGEKMRLEEAQQACTTANERWEEAMTRNEDLRDQAVKDKEEADGRIAALEKALEEETAQLASERVAYPDLCMAAVEQFKRFADFQMAVDTTITSSLANEGNGGVEPSGVAAGGRSEEEVIQSFQWSDFYKHEMSEFRDSSWMTFKHKAQELFPNVDFSLVKVGEDDVAQTPLDEGIEEKNLASSEEE
ncbi:hypothetical protein CsSME_00014721 [Camellia sinensis var. sinensis]